MVRTQEDLKEQSRESQRGPDELLERTFECEWGGTSATYTIDAQRKENDKVVRFTAVYMGGNRIYFQLPDPSGAREARPLLIMGTFYALYPY